jgi:hypothetical protein
MGAHIDFATELQALLPNFAPGNKQKTGVLRSILSPKTAEKSPENGRKGQENAVCAPKTLHFARKKR